MKAEREACALPHKGIDWNAINWRKVNRNVSRLQARIVKATREGRWGKVKALQRLLTHSYSGKAMAVRRVTENRGRRTPGVDGEIWDTPAKKARGMERMKQRGYRPKPLRRKYIPKSSDPTKKRPLGIPTHYDRAMQALYLMALEPVAETKADPNSYGFRKERSTADAIEQCFTVLAGKTRSPEWVLEGDIRACFDRISHDWLLTHIPLDKEVLRKWLKAGYMEKDAFHATEAGTPQGGIISPVLANLALDGLEKEVIGRFRPINRSKPSTMVNFVRYADDWIVTAKTREMLEEQILPVIEVFLRERGLELSPEKTHITHITEGFDFLGQNIRKYNGKLIIKPSKKSLKAHLKKIRDTIRANLTATAGGLITQLNPILRGWADYHRHVCSKQTFSYVSHATFRAIWQWARRRHPNKGAKWVQKKYFTTIGNRHWVFYGTVERKDDKSELAYLVSVNRTPIKRHIKIRGAANPFDPQREEYFDMRTKSRMVDSLKGSKQLLSLWKGQKGSCPQCGQPVTLDTQWHVHHIVQRSMGGSNAISNLQMLHPTCHRQIHCR